jgi:hypothetical protein
MPPGGVNRQELKAQRHIPPTTLDIQLQLRRPEPTSGSINTILD